tara:strand:- start:289 stop:657 length:369 start_codon:yes stop_codon:yes gene_type:complete
MTQRRNRSLESLRATWSNEKQQKEPQQKVSQVAKGSHTQKVAQPETFHGLPRATERPQPSSPAKKTTRKQKQRIYLNVVLSADVEKRLERAVAFFQRSHGKAFGKSAYGRKALLAQLERDGF